MHRRNIAERAIQTWKSHAIGVLCGLPNTCPLGLWCQLLPQIDMQVNLLRQSNTNPNVCAWTVLKGAHDFNRHPLAPLGIEMHMLTPAKNRRSWGVKSEKCFYIKTSLEHYRYFKGWHPKTRAVQGSETVLFKHKYITAPAVTPADAIIQAAKELEDTIKGKIPPPLAKSGIDRLKECTNIFGAQFTAGNSEDGAGPPRVGTRDGAAPPRVERRDTRGDMAWQRTDKNAKCFLTTLAKGPK